MSFKRISLTGDDRRNKAAAMDKVYNQTDGLFSKINHRLKYSTFKMIKLIIGEITANLLDYDNTFSYVKVDIHFPTNQERFLDIRFRHDGNAFNPLDKRNNCPTIQGIADEILKITQLENTAGSSEAFRFAFRIDLNKLDNES